MAETTLFRQLMKRRELIEGIIVFLLFFLLLYLGPASVKGHLLHHDYPVGHLASDNYQHIQWAENILQEGSYRYAPIGASQGLTDVVGHYPLMHSHLGAITAKMSGLATHDTMLIMPYLFAAVAALMVYMMLRRISVGMALLSMPVFMFMAVDHFSYIFLWGQFAMLMGSFFYILMVWALSRIGLKGSFLLFAIAMSASFMGHPPEFFIAYLFCLLYMAYRIASTWLKSRKIDWSTIRFGIFSGIAFVIISLNYLSIFIFAIQPAYGPFDLPLIDPANPYNEYLGSQRYSTAALEQMGIVKWAIFLGAALLVLSFIMSWFVNRKQNAALLFSLFMLAFGYFALLGGKLGNKALPQRYYWPITLAPLFAYGLYQLIRFIAARVSKAGGKAGGKAKAKPAVFMVIGIVLTAGFVSAYYEPLGRSELGAGSIVTQYWWDGITFIRDNSNPADKVLFLYGVGNPQSGPQLNTFRDTDWVPAETIIEQLESRVVSRYLYTKTGGESTYHYPQRTGFFSFRHNPKTPEGESWNEETVDICSRDFVFVEKAARYPQAEPLIRHNVVIANLLLRSGFFQVVFDNPQVAVLRNSQPGADCIPQEGILFQDIAALGQQQDESGELPPEEG